MLIVKNDCHCALGAFSFVSCLVTWQRRILKKLTSSPLVQDVRLSDWDNVSVSLVWRSPAHDGGRPVTHYLIEQKGKYDMDFVQVFTTEGESVRTSNTKS